MKQFEVNSIGTVRQGKEGVWIELDPDVIPALLALDGFSHIQVIWWFDGFDNKEARKARKMPKPYQKAPEMMGVFATRSPVRPNPIALSAVEVLDIDYEKGIIRLTWMDANDGSPVLDIKPYTPSIDRVEDPRVPQWCGHWPKSLETSGEFDWENEFLF